MCRRAGVLAVRKRTGSAGAGTLDLGRRSSRGLRAGRIPAMLGRPAPKCGSVAEGRCAMTERDERIAALRGVDLLSGLGEAQIGRFADQCSFQRLDTGETVIADDGDVGSTDAFLVLEGTLVARSRSRDGREIAFLTVESGGLFGEFSAIDGAPRAAEIVAAAPSWVARLPSARLRELILVMPVVGLRLCELLVAKNRAMSQRLFEFATKSVRCRVHATLHRLAAECARDGRAMVERPPTQYEIAIAAGTNRETVSREMAALARDGVIEYDRRSLHVPDLERLRHLAESG